MDLSFSEIILVLVVALFVFGPEDLARKSRKLGQWMGRVRNEVANFRIMAEDALIKEKDLDVVTDLKKTTLEIEQSLQQTPQQEPKNESLAEADIERRIQEMGKLRGRGEKK